MSTVFSLCINIIEVRGESFPTSLILTRENISMTIYYTYRISWSKFDKHYYGVRYAKNCRPSDLWVTYFTSSKMVKNFREMYGEPDIIQIRKTFETAEKARLWEYTVLSRLKVLDSDRWLNKSYSGEKFYFCTYLNEGFEPWNKGKTGIYSKETLKKMRECKLGKSPGNKGKPHSKETLKKISESLKGENHPNYGNELPKDHRRKISESNKITWSDVDKRSKLSSKRKGKDNPFYGKKHTDESNNSRREKLKNCFWWTDGQTEVKSTVCPSGFRRGRKPKSLPLVE